MKKILLTTIIYLVFLSSFASAQNGFDQLIKSSPADATKLIGSFAEPLFKGFGTGLNSGWNNTAKTKKFLHFDLRITATVAQVPTSDQSFDVTKIGLSNHLQLDPSSPTSIAPTFGGSKNGATPLLDILDDNGHKISSFSMPNGVIQYIPAPNVQLTIGLVKNTDLTIRTTPTLNISDNVGSISMFGFGLKHNIAGDLKVIPFDLAVAVNYNRIKYSKSLDVKPDNGYQPAPGSQTDFSTQSFTGTFSGTNVQVIISKKLLFFTPFLSAGYQTANTNVSILGNYPVDTSTGYYGTISNPVHINENSISGFRADAGFQLNLAILRIYASVSEGQYLSANAGIGLGF